MSAESSASGKRAVLVGIAFMLAGVSMFPVMNSIAKTLAAHYPPLQVTWARFAGHALIIALVFMPKRGLGLFRTKRVGGQLGRSLVFFGSNVCFIAALPHIELATASAITFTVPVLVTVMSVVFLGERIGVWRWSAVAIGFSGAVIVVQPDSGELNIGALLVMGSASCYSVYQIMTSQLTKVDPADTQIMYTALIGAIVATAILPFIGRMPDSPTHVVLFIILGCIGAFSHFLVIQALKRASASVMSPLGYVELLGASVLGYLIFSEIPGARTWIGATLIVASGLLIAYRQSVRATQSKTDGAA